MKKLLLALVLASVVCFSLQANDIVNKIHEVYEAEENGHFITYGQMKYCTHRDTIFAYALTLSERNDVDKLYVLDKENDKIAEYSYTGWIYSGELWDSRKFKKNKGDAIFSDIIILRNTAGGTNDVFHLKSFIDKDNYEIQYKDPRFTVSSIDAYATIFTCIKD